MAELTYKEIEYINTKPERKDGLIIGKTFAEIFMKDTGMSVEDMKNSPYFIDKKVNISS